MGYLKTAGAPLRFGALKKVMDYIKEHGILQFINLHNVHKHRRIPRERALKWGDEVEYHLIYLDHVSKHSKLLLNAADIIPAYNNQSDPRRTFLQPEYGAWMLEAIPRQPFVHVNLKDVAQASTYFRTRRENILSFLRQFGPLSISSLPSYPMMGVGDYATRLASLQDAATSSAQVHDLEALPLETSRNLASQSQFTFDAAINSHPRFPTLTRMIRERRGEKVNAKVPLYKDMHTGQSESDILMDSMAFGMGCCCLQLTFEAQSMNHARYLHDQLLVFGPILAALSASAPIYRGRLSDIDLRFDVVSQSVDDRTPAERLVSSPHYVHKSRYSSSSHFISNHVSVLPHHNDTLLLNVSPKHLRMLVDGGVDERLAYHVGGLFVRDPLVVFENGVEVDDATTTAHFENLQSTVWTSLRFKPPPGLVTDIGWRVEFRPLDIQLTEEENAALTALVTLLVKLLTERNVNFLIPISLCDINMQRAHSRDAAIAQKFYFRTNIFPASDASPHELQETDFLGDFKAHSPNKEQIIEMTLAEILEGKSTVGYPGLIPLLESLLLEEAGTDKDKERIRSYLHFLLDRAKGRFLTGAKYIRQFVRQHPLYRRDSLITHSINYDLQCHLDKLNAKNVDPKAIYQASNKQMHSTG